MHLDCDCGFEGAVRIINGVGRCFGCDSLWREDHTKVTEPPQFSSMEEMLQFARDHAPPKDVEKTVALVNETAKKSKKGSPFQPREDVFSSVHFYRRKLDSWRDVLKTAREERAVRNSTVLVTAHDHPHDHPCNQKCRNV